MNDRRCFSAVTKKYLNEYRCILDRMISGMTGADLGESISYNFIVQMIPHHIAAIEMSENILKYTDNIQLECIADNIISEQEKSIKNMEEIKCLCSELDDSERKINMYRHGTDRIICNMFTKMNNAVSTNSVNCNFLREMIPHHKGAVEMAELTMKFNSCSGLRPILSSIIREQKKGIAQMNNLLCRLSCCI